HAALHTIDTLRKVLVTLGSIRVPNAGAEQSAARGRIDALDRELSTIEHALIGENVFRARMIVNRDSKMSPRGVETLRRFGKALAEQGMEPTLALRLLPQDVVCLP